MHYAYTTKSSMIDRPVQTLAARVEIGIFAFAFASCSFVVCNRQCVHDSIAQPLISGPIEQEDRKVLWRPSREVLFRKCEKQQARGPIIGTSGWRITACGPSYLVVLASPFLLARLAVPADLKEGRYPTPAEIAFASRQLPRLPSRDIRTRDSTEPRRSPTCLHRGPFARLRRSSLDEPPLTPTRPRLALAKRINCSRTLMLRGK